ncbi:Ras-related protein Rab [Acrasis kona]|uniref:Ras-related protein Rab n=1 Tax=Acrasis kona TaxID=1008807 RepID=A0AAW2ZBT0_9EUKA
MKVIVVGNGRVGKTSLVRRFATGKYDEGYKQTIGVAFTEKEKYIEECKQAVTFHLWDTAGQEEFAEMTKQYYRGAKGCVLAFSTTDRDSFEAIPTWNEKVKRECDENMCKILIQNKYDLRDKSVVTDEEADKLAADLGLKFYRSSVKNGDMVEDIFDYLAGQYYKQQETVIESVKARKAENKNEEPDFESPFSLAELEKRQEENRKKRKKECCT